MVLSNNFEMTNLGLTKFYLEVGSNTFVYQSSYIKKYTLENYSKVFSITSCTSSKIFMDPSPQLQKLMDTNYVDSKIYKLTIGNFIYITNRQLNICYGVNYLSRYIDLLEEI